jgi:hypothetical protein
VNLELGLQVEAKEREVDMLLELLKSGEAGVERVLLNHFLLYPA